MKIEHDEVVMDQGVRAIMMVPENGNSSAIELLEPVIEDSPISKFMDKKGEGMHHICYLVDDINIGINHLKEKGACFGQSAAYERPMWYALNGKVGNYKYSYEYQNWYDSAKIEKIPTFYVLSFFG